jgi:hypothetical protein
MKHKRASLLLICALSTTTPASASADAVGDMIGVMFRMMLYMMGSMGDSMGGSNSWGMPMKSFGLGMTGWPALSGLSGLGGGWPGSGFGTSPWSLPLASNTWGYPLSAPGYFNNPYSGPWGYPMNRRWSGAGYPNSARYVSASLLNGKWYGASGETLEIRGNRFRLRNGRLSVNGTLKINNNVVNLITQRTGAEQRYQFARNQTSLVLQDAQGNTLTYYLNPRNSGYYPVRVF